MHDRKLFPKLIFYVLLIFSVNGMAQQAPFTGGEGDGYDMASWGGSTAVAEDFSQPFKISPQPIQSDDWIHISSSFPLHSPKITLFDITGKQILSHIGDQGELFSFKLPALAPGFYVIRLHAGEKMAVKRVQIIRK